MRVLIVVSTLGYGGAERQVVLLSREMARRGHDVLVYTLNAEVPRRGELDGSRVELVVDQKRMRLDPLVLRRLRRTVQRFRPEVVHGFLYDGELYARLACVGLGVPVLNSERSDDYRLSPQQRLGFRLTRPLVDGIVANSHAGAAHALHARGARADRMHVVWNGIDLAEIDARLARSADPAAAWRAPGGRLGCFVGMIKPAKDHALALQVCRELLARDPRWRFVFVGVVLKGGDAYERRVLETRRRLGLDSVVAFVGSRADVPEIMAGCDVLLVTSRHEGFPNVVLEAMSCGTPVATTDYSDARRILPLPWQVAARRDAPELADIVERCTREHDAVARAQRRWVETHAEIGRVTEALLDVYRGYLRAPLGAARAGSAP